MLINICCLTLVPVGEIYRMRKKFVEAVKNPNEMTKEEFFALPGS
jgi:hypothetical protein